MIYDELIIENVSIHGGGDVSVVKSVECPLHAQYFPYFLD